MRAAMEAYAHLKSGDELKAEGNAEFRAGRHAAAVAKYKAALKKKTLEASLRSSLLCNVAVCQVKLEQWEEAITAASECLRGDDGFLVRAQAGGELAVEAVVAVVDDLARARERHHVRRRPAEHAVRAARDEVDAG